MKDYEAERERLRNIIKGIPGGVAMIAKRANCSISYVSQVLSGTKNSPKIIDLAIEFAEEYKTEYRKRINKINDL